MSPIQSLLEAAVRTATPLLLAAVGEVVVERAGIINIGLEGLIIGGAVAALDGAAHAGGSAGIPAAPATGGSLALFFFLFPDLLGTPHILTGTPHTYPPP